MKGDGLHLTKRAFRDWSWRFQATCADGQAQKLGVSPDLWMDEPTSVGWSQSKDGLTEPERRARYICLNRCPVQRECLETAMTPAKVTIKVVDKHGREAYFESTRQFEEYGIWGGSTPRERRRFYKLEGGLEMLQDKLKGGKP